MEKNEDVGIYLLLMILAFAILFSLAIREDDVLPEEPQERIVENSVEIVENTTLVETTTQVPYVEMTVVITAYCPCTKCCGKSDGITATGTLAKQGRTIAVDPRYIPYGTEVIIDGMGTYIAEDCGGAIKGNRIDVFFSSHEKALKFGRQTKKVRIME